MTEQNFTSMRTAMVASQLRTTAVSDPQVVAAMQSVPRERFVPEARRALAYVDIPVPLGEGRALNAPMATGLLLTAAELKLTDSVLLIGAATGYCAALLAKTVASVIAVECDAALIAAARANVADLENVTLVEGPLSAGAAGFAAFDLVVIDGAVEQLSISIVDQLRDSGRLVTGLIEAGVCRLARGVKVGKGVTLSSFADADCAHLPGFELAKDFIF
ncbi:MAG: hypothetical protein RIS52_1620 [Pseudomonadota bacterium]